MVFRRREVCVALLLAIMTAQCPAVSATDCEANPEWLILHHVGQEDASLPQIALSATNAIACKSLPTVRVVRVRLAPPTFAELCRELAKAPPAKQLEPFWTGTFDVSSVRCRGGAEKVLALRRIDPQTFLRWVDILNRDATDAFPVPETIHRIATIVRSANRTSR